MKKKFVEQNHNRYHNIQNEKMGIATNIENYCSRGMTGNAQNPFPTI